MCASASGTDSGHGVLLSGPSVKGWDGNGVNSCRRLAITPAGVQSASVFLSAFEGTDYIVKFVLVASKCDKDKWIY